MQIEPIGSISQVQTTAQRAANGDPIAISNLEQTLAQIVSIQSPQLEPAEAKPPSGVPELGKGKLVDLYD